MFVHHIDPIIGTVLGVHLWWYGLSYALGFLNAHIFLRRRRAALGLSIRSIYTLTLLLSVGVLLGGRAIVVNNEWAFYSREPALIPALWLGGLATHGLIIGGATGVWLFCVGQHRPFRPMFDVLAVSAALILGFGRIGNFIDGQIVGRIADVPWAVRFPDAEGFRHPVVLYDGLKNFMIVPILIWISRRHPPAGRVAAWFLVLYSVPRIFIDLLREYPLTLWSLPSGQTFNLLMAVAGALLLLKSYVRPGPSAAPTRQPETDVGWRVGAFALLLLFVLAIPSDATRDVPARYGARHPGLTHSAIYPAITPAAGEATADPAVLHRTR
jgi:phosphatidylglycerol:prolipoprotein diacylglycerol transferase